MQTVSNGDNLHEMSLETICMNCQILFSGKSRKIIINSSSAEFSQRVVKALEDLPPRPFFPTIITLPSQNIQLLLIISVKSNKEMETPMSPLLILLLNHTTH